MNKFLRITLHVASILGLLVMALLPGNPYDFMHEMDPSIPANAIENGSGNAIVAASAIFAIVVLVQIAIAVKASRPRARVLPVALVLFGLAILATKMAG
ncbi:hypothetical protein [Acidovorax sp. NCPPB 3576]|uniref:hypothetical protein n=1 Tax=Acidovorax sp. NCPPB 3576 TaxID=2940488 RepID=UPI002349EBC3|nr:hypothetical protein [Acidovorax sp. NCPPB 3576]WCM89754.1 hypothetical protein M5C98_06855 [Acidovorax sp. NCPPB 3576]